MKKFIFTLATAAMAIVPPAFATQQSFDDGYVKRSQWLHGHEKEISDFLVKKGIIKGTVIKNVKIDTEGSASNSLCIFKINADVSGVKHSYIVKLAQEYGRDFRGEEKIISTNIVSDLQNFMAQYSKANNVKLPQLISYHDASLLTVLDKECMLTTMSKARGQSLDYFNHALYGTYNTKQIDFTQENENAYIEMATQVGHQMGAATRAFFEKNQEILIHPDIGSQNFMYDAKRQQLYWIDLSGINSVSYKTKSARSFATSQIDYLEEENSMIKNLWWAFFPFQNRFDFKKMDASTFVSSNVMKAHQLGVKAGNAFIDGYFEEVCNLDPAQNLMNFEHSFKKTILDQTNDYLYTIYEAYGIDKGQFVIDQIFGASLENQPDFRSVSCKSILSTLEIDNHLKKLKISDQTSDLIANHLSKKLMDIKNNSYEILITNIITINDLNLTPEQLSENNTVNEIVRSLVNNVVLDGREMIIDTLLEVLKNCNNEELIKQTQAVEHKIYDIITMYCRGLLNI